jgi:hypothetical protein
VRGTIVLGGGSKWQEAQKPQAERVLDRVATIPVGSDVMKSGWAIFAAVN